MNETEGKALQWLKEHGASEESIQFQRHASPDFLTNIGKFEVKKAQSKFVIFTKNQIKLLETNETTFLVYVTGQEEPLCLNAQELQQKFKLAILNNDEEIQVKIDVELIDKLRK